MPEERSGIVTLGGNPVTLVGREIKVGDKAPAFTALGTDMSPVRLEDSRGKVRLITSVLSLDTGICAEETQRFNRLAADHPNDLEVLTISMDLPFAQKRFCGANEINNAKTVSDHRDASFGEAYGALIKERRLLCRTIFVVDKDDTVRFVQYVPEVGTHPDYDGTIQAVERLIHG